MLESGPGRVGKLIRAIFSKAGVKDPQVRGTGTEHEAVAKVDLRQQTLDLLPLVRPPSIEEGAALERIGFVFLPVLAKSFAQVVTEDPGYFWPATLEYINGMPALRDFTPPAMVVGINRTQPFLLDSRNKPREAHLAMIEQYSQREIEPKFPGAKAIALPATAYAQADRAYRERTDGELFSRSLATRDLAMCLDETSNEQIAIVAGRHGFRFIVSEWDIKHDFDDHVSAFPAIVFLKNR